MRKTPGVDKHVGSRGTESRSFGMTLAARVTRHDYFTYVTAGTGRSRRESVWEAAMAAAHYQAGRLIVLSTTTASRAAVRCAR